MLRAIPRRKEAAQEDALQNKTDLLQFQDSIPVPTTYTIVEFDVFYDTLNLQPAWIRLVQTLFIIISLFFLLQEKQPSSTHFITG